MFSEVAKNTEYILVKPQTFMNDSGKAVQAALHFFKVSPEDLIVVHDDLDIPFGSYKIQKGTGPKAHNGLTSIYLSLGDREFTHVRIGVDNRQGDKSVPPKNYVLQPFSKEEETVLQTVIENVAAQLQQ
jgi:PTH1 family peptidyl-tRNA hydrolase